MSRSVITAETSGAPGRACSDFVRCVTFAVSQLHEEEVVVNRVSWIAASGLVCVLVVALVACGGEAGQSSGREEEFAAVLEQKSALDSKRDEMSALEERIAAAAAGGVQEQAEVEGDDQSEVGGEAETSVEALEAELDQLVTEEIESSESFMTTLIAFLNSANMTEGEAPTGLELQAIHLKSSEDMLIAEEYIRKGGDYRRALEILDTSLMLDPENPELLAAREQADVDQYMTPERFEMIAKGMTDDDVRKRLGTPNRHNVREYSEKNVTAWFFRREDGSAAGVWFDHKDGVMTVYRMDFNAIKSNREG